jgi:Transglycosylase SLT domain
MMIGLAGAYDSQILASLPQYCPSCPPSMVLALVQTESSGNPNAVSPAGAIGLFQLMPGTAGGLNVNPNVISGNIQGGETYLQQLYNQFGNWPDAIMAYNEGPGALQSQLNAGVTPTSTGYAQSILTNAGIDDNSSADAPEDSEDLGDTDDTTSGFLGLSSGTWVAIAAAAGGLLLLSQA